MKTYIKTIQDIQILDIKETKTKNGEHVYGIAKVYVNGQLYARTYVPSKLMPLEIGTYNAKMTYTIDLENKKIDLAITNIL